MTMRKSYLLHRRPGRQHGVMTLVVAVVILVALTLVTLYTASPVRNEQQVTANERRSHQALNAAEAGLAQAMAAIQSYNHDEFLDGEYDFDLCGEKALDDGAFFEVTQVAGQPCAAGWPPFGMNETVLGYRSIPVVSVGRSDDKVALRALGQTYFLIDPRDPSPAPEGTVPPLNFAGPVTFNAPNSNSLEVDGVGGPSIGLASTTDQQHVLQAITDVGRAHNYKGAIAGDGFAPPYDNPDSLKEFISAIYAGPHSSHQGNQTLVGNNNWNGINVVKGDMEFRGNSGGSGVLIVEGNLKTSGTPAFSGLIIVLGGTYHVGGGGGGGLAGAVFVANMDLDNTAPEFGNTEFKSDGGGNALFTASAEDLRDACNLLPQAARDLWDCNDVAIGLVDDNEIEPFAPVTGILSGSWIDF